MKHAPRRTLHRLLLTPLLALLAQTSLVITANADEPAASGTENWVNVTDAFTKQIAVDDLNPGYLVRSQGMIVTPNGDIFLLTATQGICVSRDQGATWSVIPDNNIWGRWEDGSNFSVAYPYDGRMAFFGFDGKNKMSGGMSLDDGKTWKPFAQLRRGVQFGDVDWNTPDPQVIFGVTHEPYFSVLSNDGGKTFQRLYPDETGRGPEVKYSVGVIDAKTLVRYRPNPPGGIIELSGDAEQTWTQVSADYEVQGRRPVHYGQKVYWTTTKGVIVSPNGKDWTLTGPGAEGAVYGPYFGATDQEFVVGTRKDFLKTEDGGKTWKPIAKLFKSPGIFHNNAGYGYFGWDPKHNILYATGLASAVYQLKL